MEFYFKLKAFGEIIGWILIGGFFLILFIIILISTLYDKIINKRRIKVMNKLNQMGYYQDKDKMIHKETGNVIDLYDLINCNYSLKKYIKIKGKI